MTHQLAEGAPREDSGGMYRNGEYVFWKDEHGREHVGRALDPHGRTVEKIAPTGSDKDVVNLPDKK